MLCTERKQLSGLAVYGCCGPRKIAELAAAVAGALGRGSDYNFYNPSAFIISSAPRIYRLGREDCACALQNIFLAAHSLGIGSVWINQLSLTCDHESVRPVLDKLGVPADHVSIRLCGARIPQRQFGRRCREKPLCHSLCRLNAVGKYLRQHKFLLNPAS